MTVVMWHNPRCSTSRKTLQLLRDRGVEPELMQYLKTPPDAAELKRVLKLMGKPASALIRRKEKATIKEAGLDSGSPSEADYITAMQRFPVLIERPLVIKGNKAALGRPPEAVLAIL